MKNNKQLYRTFITNGKPRNIIGSIAGSANATPSLFREKYGLHFILIHCIFIYFYKKPSSIPYTFNDVTFDFFHKIME